MNADELKNKLSALDSECQSMQSFLELRPSGDPDTLVERLTDVNVYIARSGLLLAEAKYIQETMQSEVYKSYPEYVQNMSATSVKNFVNSQTADANYYVNWLDRINRSLVHAGDNLRTQVSYAKEEMRLTKNGY